MTAAAVRATMNLRTMMFLQLVRGDPDRSPLVESPQSRRVVSTAVVQTIAGRRKTIKLRMRQFLTNKSVFARPIRGRIHGRDGIRGKAKHGQCAAPHPRRGR